MIFNVITVFPNFKKRLIFDIVQISDDQMSSKKSNSSKKEKNIKKKSSKRPVKAQGRKKNDEAFEEENEPETISNKQSQTGNTIKPIVKIQKGTTTNILIMQLTLLLKDLEENAKVSAILVFYYDKS